MNLLDIIHRRPLREALRYGVAVLVVKAGLLLYMVMTAWAGSELPTFITFYPGIMLVALLCGFWPGVAATALAGAAVGYWIMPPVGQLSVALTADRLALALFGAMGLFISAVAEATRRSRRKAAAYEREQALRETRRESEEQYRLLFDANPNPMFVFDEDTLRFLAINGAAVRHYGWSREEFLAMSVLDIRPFEDRALAMEVIPRHRGAKEALVGAMRHCRKDGTVMDMEITVSSIPFAGRPGRLCSLNDVTENRRFEEALRKAHAELLEHAHKLEETNRDLEGFAYTISHDLRAPLRAINGFARMLAEDYGSSLEEEAKRRLEIIEKNAVKMGMLIDDLLAFSRAGRTAINSSPIDMNGLVADLVEGLKSSEAGARAGIHLAPLPPALGDPALIRQVLVNLLENAVKFSRNRPDPRIEIGSRELEGEQVYFVKDNGVGFDMRYYDKLFGVFQRLVTDREFEGTGVGLAIVQRLVARHGGRVWAEAGPGEGATFFFTLNRKQLEHE